MALIRITAVSPLDGLTVRLTFSDGSRREIDLSPLLKGAIFEPILTDPDLFRQVSVDAELGTIVWPNGADLCPDVLYHGRAPASLEESAQ
jgi:hypothetical protein